MIPDYVASKVRCENRANVISRIPGISVCALLVLVLLLGSGCAVQSVWTVPNLPAPRVTKLPITVGVYYSESFRQGQHRDRLRSYVHHPGPAAVSLFDQVLEATFERVVQLPVWPPTDGTPPEVSLVIVPQLSYVSSAATEEIHIGRIIAFEISIVTRENAPVDAWEVKGVGAAGAGVMIDHAARNASALRAAAARLLIELRERPTIVARIPASEPTRGGPNTVGDRVSGAGIVLLEQQSRGEGWAKCIRDAAGDATSPVRFVEAAHFRDQVFPWLEQSMDFSTSEAKERLKQPALVTGALEAGVTYFGFVYGDTTNSELSGPFGCAFGPMGGGCFGVGGGTRESQIRIWVWDVLRGQSATEIEAKDSGAYTWIGFVLPIPIVRMTETRACAAAAASIRQFVQAR